MEAGKPPSPTDGQRGVDAPGRRAVVRPPVCGGAMVSFEQSRKLENQVILLSVAAAMFAWVMQAVLDFYFHYWDRTYPEVLLLDIPPREIYSRVVVTLGFLLAGIIISRMARRIDAGEKITGHLNASLRAIRAVNQLITRVRTRAEVVQGACDRLVESRGYQTAEIELGGACLEMVASAGAEATDPAASATITTPLKCGSEVYGELSVTLPPGLASEPDEHELLTEVGEDLAFAIHGIAVEEERARTESAQRALYQVSNGLNTARGTGHLQTVIQYGLAGALEDASVRITFCDPETGKMSGQYPVSSGSAGPTGMTEAAETLVGCVAKMGIPLLVDRAQIGRMIEEQVLEPHADLPEVWAGVPFDVGGDVRGVLSAEHPTDAASLRQEEMEILGFVADQVGKCIERQHAEEAIREQREELQTILDSVPAYIFYKDREAKYLRANRALAEVTGIPAQDWVGKTIEELLPGCGDGPTRCDLEVIRTGQPKLGCVEAFEIGGKLRWLNTDRIPYRDKSGAIVGVIGLSIDATEQREAEAALVIKEEELRQSQKMEAIGLLAGGIAHDFNNLLTAISGYTELSLGGLDREGPLAENLLAIHRAADRAAALTHQLLAFSRRQPLRLAVVDLNSVVEGVRDMLGRLMGEDIELVTELGADLPSVSVDPAQMEQVIVNLAVNARDAMPDGGALTIATEKAVLDERQSASVPRSRAGTFACLRVSDVGIGMNEDTMARIFEPFFTTKGPRVGTGLGLSVTYGNVAQHDGWINVESEPGRGTTFRVYLPETSGEPEEAWNDDSAGAAPKGTGERILLVEDEELIRTLAARVLREGGYAVVEATTAEEALEALDDGQGPFDLVFSDVVLPGMSGVQLADTVISDHPDSRVLLCSGYADRKSQWPLICERGIPFLDKPYSVSALLKVVRSVMQ